MAMELEIATKELQKNEGNIVHSDSLYRVKRIFDSVANKVKDFPTRLVGRAKEMGEELKSAFGNIPQKLEELGNQLFEHLAKFLKNILEKLSDFWAALVGAMFDFAYWVQGVATKRNFSIKQFDIEVPSTEIDVLIVGTIPIPIPKFKTPKLSVSFSPSSPQQHS